MKTKFWGLLYFGPVVLMVAYFGAVAFMSPVVVGVHGPYSIPVLECAGLSALYLMFATWLFGDKIWVSEDERA